MDISMFNMFNGADRDKLGSYGLLCGLQCLSSLFTNHNCGNLSFIFDDINVKIHLIQNFKNPVYSVNLFYW